VARVLAFVPDLLFGSNVLGALRAAGHEAALVSRLSKAELSKADVVVVDLTAEAPARIELVRALGLGARPRTLAFYSHVEAEVREQAQAAGFDMVIPRSRMAREGGAVVSRLAGRE
jgi:DNA-binding NarL/FixJ family response regulator